MNFLKKGFLAVVRKPIKSILLIALIYCVSTLVMIGISAGGTSMETQRDAKNSVGAHLILGLDMDDYYNRIERLEEEGYDLTVYPEPPATQIAMQAPPNFEFISLRMDDIESLAKIDGIKDYNVEATMNPLVEAVDFQRVEGKFSSDEENKEVTLRGVRDASLLPIIQNGSIVLKEGRLIEVGDVGKLVISEELAELNQLTIGDSLTLKTVPMPDLMMLEVMKRFGFEEPEPVLMVGEVVGIFKNNRSISFNPGIVSQSSENTIFSDLDFPRVGMYEEDPFYETASFYVTDVDDIQKIETRLRDVDIDWDRYTLIQNQEESQELSPAFARLQKMGKLLLGVVLLSGLGILTLVFTFLMKGRAHEIGIWLALGISKKEMALQLIWEALIAMTIAMLLCLLTMPFILKGAEQYFEQQVVMQEYVDEESSYEETYMQNDEEELEKIVLSVTVKTVILTIGIIIILIIVAVSLAMIPFCAIII